TVWGDAIVTPIDREGQYVSWGSKVDAWQHQPISAPDHHPAGCGLLCVAAGLALGLLRVTSRTIIRVLPQFSPMRLAVRREPFDSPECIFEVKYDGFRALAILESGSCRLVSRKAHVYKSFPGLCASLAQLPHEVILDGEIVCLDENGCPQFNQLFYRRAAPA